MSLGTRVEPRPASRKQAPELLDIFWMKAKALEDTANRSDPDVIAVEVAEDLRSGGRSSKPLRLV
jgi:hypothetical protein